MNKILVATDGSDSAAEAVEFGIELAAEHEAELILVHVVPALDIVPASGFGIGGAFPHEPSLEDRRAPRATQRPSQRSHGIFPTTVLLAGDTVDEIVAYADSHNVDLIVVGIAGSRRDRECLARKRLARSPGGVQAARAGRPRRSVDSSFRQCAPARRDRVGVLIERTSLGALAETRGRPTGLPLVR